MSAALELPLIWAETSMEAAWQRGTDGQRDTAPGFIADAAEDTGEPSPQTGLAFYRRHTEKMLRRYLYASMHVGRAPSILADPVARGFVSSRTSKTFEDAVIFVLDVERCLEQLAQLERQILSRIVLQDYTQSETAALLGISTRTVGSKYRRALDHLTEKLMTAGLLIISG